jgi:hypothetical protein
LTLLVIAPRLFFELAKTTQHDFWSATQRGADYAEALETCRCTYKAEYASGPVPKPVPYMVSLTDLIIFYYDILSQW